MTKLNVIFLLLLPLVVNAHSSYQAKSPNGNKSPGNSKGTTWGHSDGSGSSRIGTTVVGTGTYSTAICLADADTDGYSNGEELGDACCYWTSGDVDATRGALSSGGTDTRISNPRLADSTPTWSTAPINTGADIKKFRTANPEAEAFTVTSAARDVRIFCSNHFFYNYIHILTLFNP